VCWRQAGYSRIDMKHVIDTAAAIGILSDFFDKNGEGVEVVQRGVPTAASSASSAPPLVPVLSYKQRLAQMKAAAAAAAPPTGKAPRARARC
jgi:hypothetical protein